MERKRGFRVLGHPVGAEEHGAEEAAVDGRLVHHERVLLVVAAVARDGHHRVLPRRQLPAQDPLGFQDHFAAQAGTHEKRACDADAKGQHTYTLQSQTRQLSILEKPRQAERQESEPKVLNRCSLSMHQQGTCCSRQRLPAFHAEHIQAMQTYGYPAPRPGRTGSAGTPWRAW